jgi:hypothetical protein
VGIEGVEMFDGRKGGLEFYWGEFKKEWLELRLQEKLQKQEV